MFRFGFHQLWQRGGCHHKFGSVICKKKKNSGKTCGDKENYGVLMEDWRLFWAIGSWFCYGFFRFLGFFPL
jgi:hypothetical protein